MLEPLESRIAPASTFGYIDLDGDEVTLTTSLGSGTDLRDVLTTVTGMPVNRLEVAKIDLTMKANIFAGTDLTMTVTRGPNGDGFADIGAIVATGMDIGRVVIKGDLGQIDVGNPATLKVAFTSLTVKSMGVFGLATQNGAGDLVSSIKGATGPISILGDAVGVTLDSDDGSLPSVSVGGSLVNSTITSEGSINKLVVKRATVSSSISAELSIPTATFGGSVWYGNLVAGENLGAVKVTGSWVAADGDATGYIRATAGNIGSVKIGGDFRGGIASALTGRSGAILAGGNIGTVFIRGDFAGIADVDAEGQSASIDAGGRITSVNIRGSAISPTNQDSSTYTGSEIHADKDIGTVTIAGDVRAGRGLELFFISAGGQPVPTSGKDLAIKSINIGGTALGLHIAGGLTDAAAALDPFQSQGNADAQIGLVKVGGDFIRSNIVSGVRTGFATVATGDDSVYVGGTGVTKSMIRQIVIGGAVEGEGGAVNESFGFTAEKIGSVTLAGKRLVLDPVNKDQRPLGRVPTDFMLREI